MEAHFSLAGHVLPGPVDRYIRGTNQLDGEMKLPLLEGDIGLGLTIGIDVIFHHCLCLSGVLYHVPHSPCQTPPELCRLVC